MGNPSYKITSNHSKKSFKCALKNFSKTFFEYIRMEYPSYENGNIERKYLRNIRKNQFVKVKNSLLELEKDFI